MAHAVAGAVVAVGWLVPSVTADAGAGVSAAAGGGAVVAPAGERPGAAEDGTTAADLVLPVAAVGAVGALALYGHVRRTRRARARTTPGGAGERSASLAGGSGGSGVPEVSELDPRARRLLVEVDDAVRTSEEELRYAAAQVGDTDTAAVAPFVETVAWAKGELAAAFQIRQQVDDGLAEDESGRRLMLTEIVERCTDAGRWLDAQAAAFDQLRALERKMPEALAHAEARFREVAGRTPGAEAALGEIGKRHAAPAVLSVVGDIGVAGHLEQAKDRLVFAMTRLNRARAAVDRDDTGAATVALRAAEGAVDQAELFVGGVERFASELAVAEKRLPAAVDEAGADLAGARGAVGVAGAEGSEVATGEPLGPLVRAESVLDAVLDAVRRETAAGPYDPVGALRRVGEADAALVSAVAATADDGRVRALLDRMLFVARGAVAGASEFITTHRGAVGSEARTRSAEARRHLERGEGADGAEGEAGGADGRFSPFARLADVQRADGLAREARELAERDVRAYEHPVGGGHGRGHGDGVAGAVLGGILLGDGEGTSLGEGGIPGSFGGGGTRARRGEEGDEGDGAEGRAGDGLS